MTISERVSAMKYDPRYLDRAWVASSIEAASDAVEAGAIALMAAAAVAPIRDLAQALRGAQARGNEVASTVAALREGADLQAECLRLVGVLSDGGAALFGRGRLSPDFDLHLDVHALPLPRRAAPRLKRA